MDWKQNYKSSREKYFQAFLSPASLCHIFDTVSFSNKRFDIPQAQNENIKVDLSFIYLIHLLWSKKKPFRIVLIIDPVSHGPGPEMLAPAEWHLHLDCRTETSHVQFNITSQSLAWGNQT